MKTTLILPRLLMLFMFGLMLNSCTANEDELQNSTAKIQEVEITTDLAQKDEPEVTVNTVNTTTPVPPIPNENEPIIVKPRR